MADDDKYVTLLECDSSDEQHGQSRNLRATLKNRRVWVIGAAAMVVVLVIVVVATVTTMDHGDSPPPLCDSSVIQCGQTDAHQSSKSLQEQVDSDSPNGSEIWGVAYSGGGWRAQAASIGFAKALHQQGITQKLSAVSSVSGGTWFSSQYTFSQSFQDAVHSQQPKDFYTTWLKGYYPIVDPPSQQLPDDFLTKMKDVVTKIAQSFSSYYGETLKLLSNKFARDVADGETDGQLADGAISHALTWELFVTDMIDTFTTGLGAKSATQDNRASGTSYDVLFCTSMASQSQMSGPFKKLSNIRIGFETVQPLYPAAWLLGSDGKGTWKSPQPLSTMSVEYTSSSLSGWWSTPPSSQLVLDTPSIGKVTSMSSAAVGALGSPQLQQEAVSAKFQGSEMEGNAVRAVVAGLDELGLVQGMAVCSNNVTDCEYPSVRLLDGGYTDDSGIALLVSRLQAKYGVNTPLRIAALDSDQCYNATDLHASCATNVEYEAEFLYVNTHERAAEKRQVYGVPMPNKAIFDHDWSKPSIKDVHVASNNMTYHIGAYKTIENQLFGVQAGTQVTLMVFNINSMLSTILVNKGTSQTENYADLAQQTFEAASATLEQFFP